MWSLENAEALPSESERVFANEAIDALEKKREEVFAKMKKLKLEAKDLRLEISKIKAWLAPIRRVPADILSLIFVEVCQSDWQAPVELGAVCRFWREALLTTPGAWACVQIGPDSVDMPHTILSLWLSRCGIFKLHVSLGPFASSNEVNAVCCRKENLQCLSFFNNLRQLRRKYPQLEELRLGPEDRSLQNQFSDLRVTERSNKKGGKKESPTILSIKRFPKLVRLHLHSPRLNLMEAIAREDLFPALRELHIHVKGAHWHSIIRYCAQSLITLAVEYPLNYEDAITVSELETPVNLPNLRSLHFLFYAFDHEWSLTLPNLQTPCLQSYHQVNGNPETAHPAASLARFVFLEQPLYVDWTQFPSMTHLQIKSVAEHISYLFEGFPYSPIICPLLESVTCVSMLRFRTSHKAEAKFCVARRSIITGTPIRFRYIGRKKDEAPGYSFCYTYCKCDITAADIPADPYGEESYHREEDDYEDTDDENGEEDNKDDEWSGSEQREDDGDTE